MWIKIPRNYLCNLSSSAFIVIVKYSFLSYVKHYYFQTVDKNYFKKCGNVDKKPYKFNVKICEKNIKKSVDDKK